MELEFKADIQLEDGKHEGTIAKIEFREVPYEYTDIFIKESKTGMEIKVGFPTLIKPKSGLGKLLLKFDKTLKVGQKVDPEKVLVGRDCFFQTITEPHEDVEYARIVKDSVKPKPKQEELPDDPSEVP